MTLQETLDAAVLAHRANPTQETMDALMKAAEAVRDDFWRRERDEALAQGIEIYAREIKNRSQW
jgi:hypothetical protein